MKHPVGRANDFSGRNKWDCSGFAIQSDHFVAGAADGYAAFNFAGKERDVGINNIRVDDVKWYMARMGKLTDDQVRSALASSGASRSLRARREKS